MDDGLRAGPVCMMWFHVGRHDCACVNVAPFVGVFTKHAVGDRSYEGEIQRSQKMELRLVRVSLRSAWDV
jgi:hypothetical protein